MSFELACYYPAEQPCYFILEIAKHARVTTLLRRVQQELLSGYEVNLSRHHIYLFKTDFGVEPEETVRKRALEWLHQVKKDDRLDDAIVLASLFPGGPSSSNIINIMISDPEAMCYFPSLHYTHPGSVLVLEMSKRVSDPLFFQREKLRKDLRKRMDTVCPAYSPSETVGSGVLNRIRELLENDTNKMSELLESVNTGRPGGVPVAIFNPALATLQFRLDHLDQVQVDHRDITNATQYLADAVKVHHDKAARERAIKDNIDGAIGQHGSWNKKIGWAGGIKPSCCWWHEDFLVAVMELKNTVGLDGNPLVQVIVDYSKIISQEKYKPFRDFCNFPTVLLGIAENRIDISVAVCVGEIHVTKLLTLDVIVGFLASDNIIHLARVFKALSACREDLTGYYREVKQKTARPLSCVFPEPTPVDSSVVMPGLAYKGFMNRSGEPISVLMSLGGERFTAMYIAELDGIENDVLVKFTTRYNEKAHGILADAGLAPKLHFCTRVIGGLYMVVMDRVDGKSVWDLQVDNEPIPAVILEQVSKAIGLLHKENIVFGDLRESNILYNSSKNCAVIVDFDWAGVHDVDRYPATLNRANDRAWDVMPYGIMLKKHDLGQLERLGGLCKPST
ncbi:hypothetical protein H0H81_002108 [Sphagnurus paluster]|uniref:Protein kinase domain-containing protein n=1 Tax=Sphagnurus paluster TaxID=117069 RepID=A0A9P7KF14_9AGAR|nr:hypothetical protein H0H81_002108 [Sphagnurus paluster]